MHTWTQLPNIYDFAWTKSNSTSNITNNFDSTLPEQTKRHGLINSPAQEISWADPVRLLAPRFMQTQPQNPPPPPLLQIYSVGHVPCRRGAGPKLHGYIKEWMHIKKLWWSKHTIIHVFVAPVRAATKRVVAITIIFFTSRWF